MKRFNLENRTALITGAAGLLGYEHTAALLENGAKVFLTDINYEKLENVKLKLSHEFDKKNIFIEKMDVSEESSIKKLSKTLSERNKRIDILINNAAIDPKVTNKGGLINSSRLENFSLESWNNEISVGLTGAFLCCKIFGSKMAQDGKGGVILNIASDLSVIAPDQRIYEKKDINNDEQDVKPVTYSIIKTGLIGLTRYIATYWSNSKVRCNALSPGGVFNHQNKEFLDKVNKLIPIGRMADKDEYRSAIQFLCSDAASYMTGQNLIIDGGRSVW